MKICLTLYKTTPCGARKEENKVLSVLSSIVSKVFKSRYSMNYLFSTVSSLYDLMQLSKTHFKNLDIHAKFTFQVEKTFLTKQLNHDRTHIYLEIFFINLELNSQK